MKQRKDSTRILSFFYLTMLTGRLASGWVCNPLHRILRSTSSFGFRPARFFHLSRGLMARWQVGDDVLVPREDELIRGVIQETRGAGWYSIQLAGSNATVKCRGTQLRQTTTSSHEPPSDSSAEITQSITVEPTLSRSLQGPTSPPPTMVNLDAAVQALSESSPDRIEDKADQLYLQQVAHHMSFQKWVVFTDLHCAPSTLDTTLKVLETVYQAAMERNAGILFLGDFWHHRGTLRVDCLNAILAHLSNWTVPMVMIPGNHDQVSLGGHNHGLTPLENAYRVAVKDDTNATITTLPGPLIFSHPTKFASGLFVPHIRDNAIMEAVLQSNQADEATAIFVHADVTGAYMNDLIVSMGGVPPYMFPPNKTIYSGHFHKPHVVKSGKVSIEYLGSPYEVSLSEAQQPKALAVLDSTDSWKCIERIPLDIGRKHFRAMTLDEFLIFQPKHNSNGTTIGDSAAPIVRAGDRVVFSIDKDELADLRRETAQGEDSIVDAHTKSLRKAGAVVEIRETKELPVEPIGIGSSKHASELEELSLESTWQAFLREEVRRDAMSNSTAESLLEPGLEILNELEEEELISPDQLQNITELQLRTLTVEGFGPFRDEVTYPLLDRGLVLLRGTNRDGGSDSNGSGKTSLAMSALWALTGSIDPRPLEDSKVADVVNDSSKAARVTVKGALNGVDFSITRTKTSTRGSLIFLFDDEDLTTQSVKETQQLIDEKLGVSPQVLARTMFHGQHNLNELLEAADSKLKDELSLVVPLGVWQEAVSITRKKARTANKQAAELQGMISVRSEDREKLEQKLNDTKVDLTARESSFEAADSQVQSELKLLREDGLGANVDSLENLEDALVDARKLIIGMEDEIRSQLEKRDSELKPLEVAVDRATESLNSLAEHSQSIERHVGACTYKLDSARERVHTLEETWGLDLSSGRARTVEIPTTCPTCRQSISESGDGHSHQMLRETIERDVDAAMSALEEATVAFGNATEQLEAAQKDQAVAAERLSQAHADLDYCLEQWKGLIEKLDSDLQSARASQEDASIQLSQAAKHIERKSKMDSLDSMIRAKKESLRLAQAAADAVQEEFAKAKALLNDLEARRDEEMKYMKVMSDLSDAFGQRGVQTFILQNAVDMLQSATQSYLDDFSDGSQRLLLQLDAGDRISRRALVRQGQGEYKERPLASLSGGQWRRCSLALNFGFADLVARRGKLRPSLCVLDEPLTHLDRTGRSEVGRVLRKLLRRSAELDSSDLSGFSVSTILIILQDLAAEELEESFDCIDEVVKSNGVSTVLVDERIESLASGTSLDF